MIARMAKIESIIIYLSALVAVSSALLTDSVKQIRFKLREDESGEYDFK